MQLPSLNHLPPDLYIREYLPSDMDACLEIYRSNLAEFLPSTLGLFHAHLSGAFSYYLVIASGDAILGCGGLDIRADRNHAGLAFGMVRRDSHGLGIGSLLLLARLALVDREHDPAFIGLETSVAVAMFYERFGFQPLSHPEIRYVGGSYYINMGLSLTLHERDAIRAHLVSLPILLDIEFPE